MGMRSNFVFGVTTKFTVVLQLVECGLEPLSQRACVKSGGVVGMKA